MIIKYQKKAFTLLEMLTVVAIIGVIVSIVIVSYSSVRKKAMNTKIDADLSTLNSALTQYYKENGSVPDSSLSGSWCKVGVECLNELVSGGFVQKLQKGPNDKCTSTLGSSDQECYYYFNGSNFLSISGIKNPKSSGPFSKGSGCEETSSSKRFCFGFLK